jgi:hypothetical protein
MGCTWYAFTLLRSYEKLILYVLLCLVHLSTLLNLVELLLSDLISDSLIDYLKHISYRDCMVSSVVRGKMSFVVNLKGLWKKSLWPVLRCCLNICLFRQKKTTKYLNMADAFWYLLNTNQTCYFVSQFGHALMFYHFLKLEICCCFVMQWNNCDFISFGNSITYTHHYSQWLLHFIQFFFKFKVKIPLFLFSFPMIATAVSLLGLYCSAQTLWIQARHISKAKPLFLGSKGTKFLLHNHVVSCVCVSIS